MTDYEIESLVWGATTPSCWMLDDYVSLSGQTLDFIELDGSIDTSLDFAGATGESDCCRNMDMERHRFAALGGWGSADGADSGDGHGAHCRDTHADAGANRDAHTHADAHADSNSHCHSDSRQREPLSRRCDRNRFSAACTSTCPP